MCDCQFTPHLDPEDDEIDDWHYERTCEFCGAQWWGLHCPHDGYQNPCPECGRRPTTIEDENP
jgi:hypothetical protein